MNSMLHKLGQLLAIVGVVAMGGLLLILLLGSASQPLQAQGQVRSTPVRLSALSTSSIITINGAAASLDTLDCHNPNGSVSFVQLFNVASGTTVVLGTTVPAWSVELPANSSKFLSGMHLWFNLGIKAAATTSATGNVAPTTALDCNVGIQ